MRKNITILAAVFYSGLAMAQTPAPSPQAIAEKIQADEKLLADWPQLGRYRNENAALPAPVKGESRVVFMGDSITDIWGRLQGVFFPGKPYVNRGISGQVTAQMLVRFRPDVIALKPRVVVILGGTNDIANKTDPAALSLAEDNLTSMAELARANGIKVVLASLTPVSDYIQPNQTKARSPEEILTLNAWIKSYAAREHFIYLDYYPALLDANKALKKDFTIDGLHPSTAGYAVMTPLAQQAIDQVLAQ